MAVLYALFTLFAIAAPKVVSLLGPRLWVMRVAAA